MENDRKYHQGLWAMILKVEGICIGDCGITMQSIAGQIVPEIGFHIQRQHWNKGFATEAAKVCMDHAFCVLGYPEIHSYATSDNKASQRVAKKMGMRTCKVFQKNGKTHIARVASNPHR